MSILCPSNFAELREMLYVALYQIHGPVTVRYPRGAEGEFRELTSDEAVCLRQGKDITLVGYGLLINEFLRAAELLAQVGISAEVIKLNLICSDDFAMVIDSLRRTACVLIAEEVCAVGCVGRRILARASQAGVCLRASRAVNLEDGIVVHGDRDRLLCDYHLDAQSLAETAEQLVRQCGV